MATRPPHCHHRRCPIVRPRKNSLIYNLVHCLQRFLQLPLHKEREKCQNHRFYSSVMYCTIFESLFGLPWHSSLPFQPKAVAHLVRSSRFYHLFHWMWLNDEMTMLVQATPLSAPNHLSHRSHSMRSSRFYHFFTG